MAGVSARNYTVIRLKFEQSEHEKSQCVTKIRSSLSCCFHYGQIFEKITKKWRETLIEYCTSTIITLLHTVFVLTLLGLELIKINTVLANFNNPRPSLTLNN